MDPWTATEKYWVIMVLSGVRQGGNGVGGGGGGC